MNWSVGSDHGDGSGVKAATPPVDAEVSGYRPSPRPTFDEATPLRRADVVTYTWGDDGSGEVQDWLYVSSEKIHELVFGLPPHGSFLHSDEFRTIFAADELLYVLSGTLLLANPESGEAHRVEAGEAAFFRRDTWHHAHAIGRDALRVLELFAPPPAAGASGAYARSQPLLSHVALGDDGQLGASSRENRRRAGTRCGSFARPTYVGASSRAPPVSCPWACSSARSTSPWA